ncbi:MAG: bifunctional UDP-N-acetylglucosamine diphosphorylase/glucosamine-1-phosphate N-acetyltransferase GlmU [Planktomarina temperata]|jgi:bifunctional UDP-N-acetylglucosamine pyrophosphorylase/glucosamine-1-phosphate N-acetyltransferase|uniref:bifunctional UDP-N-acetylglucosamine diphosphorylase/glucosamine-1-phosphate N-acetyltransferase GlmU n=2 Tax=Paracoccaceae TaxID=31989 RepID=UPI000E99F8F0|nr:bifunctional UDP-N-acetylglucosamine diphosphorylase/glucosamine-1-phosphate N-acetyltransferase GlmU [Planktomarina temperata]MCO4816843.1 bifunctional UDP-N-acetylglucosamine diphosphorylase/glucosamine-1-phosphate N-acetyltransferase GlmU [Planktomarina temperata]MDA8751140.1 bifunctional UDP-N-acetylglucosamine diphosphorylase/glucosamine-1-phosphate N-acetyltransferase GlmU [Planktomarina temperata]MDA9940901.1 bifunctional UDP-N-acetylglucosamine diphosphorylase/glucosamine-1-phosphate 
MNIALIILAAGKGTRMQSELPKVLHEVAGAPMLVHAMRAGRALDPKRTIIIAGHGFEAVSAAACAEDPEVEVVRQEAQLGTGHAVDQARAALSDFDGTVIVLYGDCPLIQSRTLEELSATLSDSAVSVLGFEAKDPARYGRLITDGDKLKRIVEFKDASPAERAVSLCNSGVMAASAGLLFDLLSEIDANNASGELYLTDVIGKAVARGLPCTAVRCAERETLGVNSRVELMQAEKEFQNLRRTEALEDGVTMPAPETVHFSYDTVIGRDTIIEQNVVFGPGVTVESGAQIRAFSHLEGAHVSRGCIIGPYARLRPGAELAEDVKIGNFVEIKASALEEGAKVNHLSYIGDAHIGARANIGAGTITCNYDGVMKHHTSIGEEAFIGSNTMLVAPVTVGQEAMTASGSVITQDVPAGSLAIARAKQDNKPGLALKLMKKLRALKAARRNKTKD